MTVDHATLNAHFLVVGAAGSGQLTIQNGANVAAVSNFLGAGQIAIGYYNGGNGLLTITGAGSGLSSTGDLDIAVTSPLNPGDHSTGELKVIGGGPSIHIDGNLVMGVNNPILADTIDSTGISPVEVSGSASLAGRLDVELNDFTPTPGQVFRLLDANNGITGSLTLTGPDASDFTIEQGPDTLDVVYNGSSLPEPGGIAIFPVAGTLLLRRKRAA